MCSFNRSEGGDDYGSKPSSSRLIELRFLNCPKEDEGDDDEDPPRGAALVAAAESRSEADLAKDQGNKYVCIYIYIYICI